MTPPNGGLFRPRPAVKRAVGRLLRHERHEPGAGLRGEIREFGLQRVGQAPCFAGGRRLQQQMVDVQMHHAARRREAAFAATLGLRGHVQPAVSARPRGRSSLAYSVRGGGQQV